MYLKISRSSLASIYLYFACLGVCVYPINLKTVEPNGPKFCVGPHMAPGKVYGWSKFQSFASKKILFSWNFESPRFFFPKSANFCLFLFYYLYIEKMFTIEMEDVRAAPWKPSYYMFYLIVDLGTAKVLLEHWQVSCHLPTHLEILETSGIGIDLQFMRLTFYKSFNKIYDKFLFIHLYFVCLLCIQSTSKLTNRLFSGGGVFLSPPLNCW